MGAQYKTCELNLDIADIRTFCVCYFFINYIKTVLRYSGLTLDKIS